MRSKPVSRSASRPAKVAEATTAPAKAKPKTAPKKTTDQLEAAPKRAKVALDAQPKTTLVSAANVFSTIGVEISETRARPKDVEAARAGFDKKIYTATQHRWAGLIAEAMEQLGGPRIMVNRPADSALRLLETGGRFTTAFDRKADNAEYLETRKIHEERLGTHGVGDQAGKTVYGSVEFSGVRSAEPFEDAVLIAAKKGKQLPRTELNSGIELTDGAVTFVLKNDANRQATFLPGDTYIAWATPPRALEHLSYVVLENILKEGDSYFSTFDSDVMFEQKRDVAIAALKEYLTSKALDRSYLEAQVRAPTVDDIAYVVIRADDQTRRPPGATRPLADVLAEVKKAAVERGLNVLDERDLTAT